MPNLPAVVLPIAAMHDLKGVLAPPHPFPRRVCALDAYPEELQGDAAQNRFLREAHPAPETGATARELPSAGDTFIILQLAGLHTVSDETLCAAPWARP